MFVLFILSLQGLFAIETLDVTGSREIDSTFWSLTQDQSTSDIFNKSPNVTLSSGANRSRFFQIRGVGERSQFDNLNQSPVGFFYEHIDLSEEAYAIMPNNKVYKVHKGSQSVEYGSKAMGGVIEASACVSDSCKKNEVSLGVESFKTYSGFYQQTVDWSENFMTQISFNRRVSDGYQDNQFLNKKTSDQDEYYGELHNIFEGSVSVETHHILTQQKNGYDYFNVNNDYISDSDHPGREMSLIHGHSVVVEKESGKGWLKSITSLTQSKIDQSYDEDWGNNIFWQTVPGWNQNYNYFSENKFNKKKTHQKFVYESTSFDIGLHYYSMEDEVDNRGYKNDLIRSTLQMKSVTQSLALYGGLKQNINNWNFRESFRFESQEQELGGESLHISNKDELWSFELEAIYNYSQKAHLFSKLSKGFRGGGFNLDTSLSPERMSFEAEDIYLLELGYRKTKKSSDQSVKLFYMFRDEMQLRSSFQDDPGDPSSFSYYIDNASSAQIYGGEIDYKLYYDSWRIHLGLAGLISQFDDYKYGGQDLTQRVCLMLHRIVF